MSAQMNTTIPAKTFGTDIRQMESNQHLESMPQPSQSKFQSRRIGLALSGGGFRATLFHLGVVRALRDCDQLKDVKLVCSVSGGSILAAHLVLHWEKYLTKEGFNEAAREIIGCTRTDLQNKILRRWACVSTFVLPKLFGFGNPSNILAKHYDDLLYKGATFAKLQAPDRPEMHILSTSLTTGASCRFTSSHFEIKGSSCDPAPLESHKLSFAVASSSAFPLFFPPILVNNVVLDRDYKQFKEEHLLTDGGVFDNLAIEDLIKSAVGCDLLIVSDASANFDYKTERYSSVISISRNLRANAIMMHRLGKLNLSHYASPDIKLCRIAIEDELTPATTNVAPPLHVQRAVRNLETHLNATSDVEIDALLRHGQAMTWDALKKLQMCSHTHEAWPPIGDKVSAINNNDTREHTDLLFKRLRRSRLIKLAFLDWTVWRTIAAWVIIIWGSIAGYRWITAEPGQPQRCVIHVTYANAPVIGATINVRLEDADKSTYSGQTDMNGKFPFVWKMTRRAPFAHFLITKSGFKDFKDDFFLEAEPEHPVSLTPANSQR